MKEMQVDINKTLGSMRKDYNGSSPLREENLSMDPFSLFEAWFAEAMDKDREYANAMSLSTVAEDGTPDSRIVLLRNVSYGGLTFFTNYNSKKAKDMAHNGRACALFFWKEFPRQVKVQGLIKFLPDIESDRYFGTRPFESQVGAWASQQSAVVKGREQLDERFEREMKRFRDTCVPRPPHWGGYVLLPFLFEFWQGGASRLHDRIRFARDRNGVWNRDRLMP